MLLISSMMTTVLPRRSAEQADLAAAQWAQQVDDLDAGLEHLQLGRQLVELGRQAMDRQDLGGLRGPR